MGDDKETIILYGERERERGRERNYNKQFFGIEIEKSFENLFRKILW